MTGKHSHTPTRPLNPTIQITVLTISTLLILTLLILIIGPSRILSDSSSLHSMYITSLHQHPTSSNQYRPEYEPWNKPYKKTIQISPLLSAMHRNTSLPTSLQTWEDLLIPPSGGGILADKKSIAALYDHHPEIIARNDRRIGPGIAMYHQLHCLIAIRGLVFPETTQKEVNSTSPSHGNGEEEDREHWAHCFEYIAQAILCHADDTLEIPKKVINGPKGSYWHVDGVGATHQCKDPRPLWEISRQTHYEPVDMTTWNGAMGAREFFADMLKEEPRYAEYDLDTYMLGVEGF